MRTNKAVATGVIAGLLLIAAVARAAGDEKTITGVISKVDPTTRIATVTPDSGPAIFVQFAFNAVARATPVLGRAGPGPHSPRP